METGWMLLLSKFKPKARFGAEDADSTPGSRGVGNEWGAARQDEDDADDGDPE
jgi:hypothetical protein